jgi:hypothetical protein
MQLFPKDSSTGMSGSQECRLPWSYILVLARIPVVHISATCYAGESYHFEKAPPPEKQRLRRYLSLIQFLCVAMVEDEVASSLEILRTFDPGSSFRICNVRASASCRFTCQVSFRSSGVFSSLRWLRDVLWRLRHQSTELICPYLDLQLVF